MLLLSCIPVTRKNKKVHTAVSNSNCSFLSCTAWSCWLVRVHSACLYYKLFCSSVSDRPSVAALYASKGFQSSQLLSFYMNVSAEASFSFCAITLSAAVLAGLSVGLTSSLTEFYSWSFGNIRIDSLGFLKIVKISGVLTGSLYVGFVVFVFVFTFNLLELISIFCTVLPFL